MERHVVAAQFQAYGTSHQVAILVLLACAALLVRFGRSHARSRATDRLGKALALAILVFTVPLQLLAVGRPGAPTGYGVTCTGSRLTATMTHGFWYAIAERSTAMSR